MNRLTKIMFVLGFLLTSVWSYSSNSLYAQNQKFTFEFKQTSIKAIFQYIEKHSEFIFMYRTDLLDTSKKVSVKVEKQSVEQILVQVLKGTAITYEINDRQIILKKSAGEQKVVPQQPKQKQLIQGLVRDEKGEVIIGATVQVKNTGIGTATNMDGKFTIAADDPGILVVSYVGMTTKEIKLQKGTSYYSITLEPNAMLDEVVINAGIISRNKLGFTGSYTTVSQEELKSVGGINLVQALKSLDPSFVIMDNNLAGSDPNTMSTITMRGGTTVDFKTDIDDYSANSNQPLYILDGFETTLETINDLDINRIESITLLKDAGSTAIYGAKGANGVVVVETLKPKEGELMVNYSANFQLAIADLSAYSMMNAEEKLEFEALAGRYGDLNDFLNNSSNIKLYNDNLARLAQGIDTYWLKVPIRTAFTHDHSLNISGGSKSILYQIGVNYRKVEGVMKGSDRESFGGNVRVSYRTGRVNIANNLTVGITNSDNGNWGSFQSFANANPYFRMQNDDGTIPMMLDEIQIMNGQTDTHSASAVNPYYNAMLFGYNNSGSFNLTNNTSFDWFINDQWRWQASLSLFTTKADSESFKDPRHSDYRDQTDYTKKGNYNSSYNSDWGYRANTSISYGQSFLESHNLTFIGRAAIEEMNKNSKNFSVTGFPEGVMGIPSYATGYPENGKPGYNIRKNRSASFLLAFNYNYKYRYLFDFNYNLDGANSFGKNKKFQDFWSVGLGWNIHKEAFAESWKWLQEFKLRTTYGINGNQNVSNVNEDVYQYYPGNDVFGLASYLSQYANPDLKWQIAKKFSAGLNFTTINNRLNVTFDVYKTKTNPLVVSLAQRPSTGVGSLPINVGFLDTKGMEFKINYNIIRNTKERIFLRVGLTGSTTSSKYGNFDNKLAELNRAYQRASEEEGTNASQNINSLLQYEDGQSPSTLWAVRSLGIDPATGNEIFLTKDGKPTFTYNADDRVPIANSSPDIQGVFNTSFTYKRLEVSMFFRYKLGAYNFNRALYQKVENIGKTSLVYNQDRRALYDRWKQPGDIAQFKNIVAGSTPNTPVSSRFIQKDNQFRGESFKISYDFTKDKWIKKLYLKDFRVHFSMQELFVISSMKQERGLDYPFQRSFSAGISARF